MKTEECFGEVSWPCLDYRTLEQVVLLKICQTFGALQYLQLRGVYYPS
jgi:hypothetical protein